MGTQEEKGFDFNIPVVADRREFFEQEAVLSDPPGELANDLEPEEVAESLKAMRESAAKRTAAPEPESE
ncbi:MAG TPA: hypothetical protein VFV09_04430 [Actinomycetota bacterium]|jgi:hypothetical protein|nr:hypothetical protein [Actinomycetota bacterium]